MKQHIDKIKAILLALYEGKKDAIVKSGIRYVTIIL
jgi:hypothetical protein